MERYRVSRRKFDPPEQELKTLYQTKTGKQIAEFYGVGETVVWSRIKEYGIVRRVKREFSREHRQNLSKAHRGRWKGDQNPHWKGGVHQENLKARASGAYKQWRLDALALRGNKCEQCGVLNNTECDCCGTRVRLHVHHVKSFAAHKQDRYDPRNSEVLCLKCHRSRHK